MSKKKATEEKQPETKKQPAYVEGFLKNGTAILTAKTREELAEMVNEIPADCRYAAGAVARSSETGQFSLRIDIKKD